MYWIVTGLVATTIAAQAIAADTSSGAIDLREAWTPATSQTGGDSPLYVTIINRGDAPDSLMRVRCPTNLADFTEKHATDRGEGGTAMREVKNFAVPANGTVRLTPGGNHLMLLNVREPLLEDQTFTCSIVFQRAGPLSVEVKVAPGDAKGPPPDK